MNVVDSSGWLEYLAGSANADFFSDAKASPATPSKANIKPPRMICRIIIPLPFQLL